MDGDSDSDVGDILNDLLANDEPEENEEPVPSTTESTVPSKTLKELDFNFLDSTPKPNNENKPVNLQEKSEVYDVAIDSSDDEDRRNFEEQNYSDYGRDIKSLLKKDSPNYSVDKPLPDRISTKSFDFGSSTKSNVNVNTKTNNNVLISKDIYCDPFFGIRIINPLVSSAELKSRMNGKTAVTISTVKYHVASEKIENDWVIAGVLISKSPTKTSQKGSSYSIWILSDLSETSNTVCLFMFSSAYKMFWKTTVGNVIGILNPNVLESKNNTDQATLSVDNPQKIMLLGKSKDMGKCKSIKKNGEPCTSIVNISRCEYCVYHVKQEYKKCSQRAELKAFSNTQQFSMDMLKRKQQQKQFNNNTPEFHAVYAERNPKLEAKDAKRLALLSGSTQKGGKSIDDTKDKAIKTEVTSDQMKKDFNQVNRSRGWKAAVLMQSPSNSVHSSSSGMPSKTLSSPQSSSKKDLTKLTPVFSKPHLGTGSTGGTIDLSQPITKKHINIAKSNALKWVEKNGKIKAKDPNKVRLNKEEKVERGQKRPREAETCEDKEAKKPNLLSDKFKEMLQAKSAHTDLIEKSYEEEKEKYFNKLEMKEKMEEKMLTTYKVACKAVKCLVCKYTSFSASDLCKEQKHPLRVADATKRFFKCIDCHNRTVSLDRIPSHSCIKCGSSNWTRAAMMDERKTNVPVAALSIRGDEESHIGSVTKDANLNLLVPDNS